jgi:nucleotide-binding universal stress UspA family protein
MVRRLRRFQRKEEAAMFDRILVPLDGSDRAERVLSQIARILRRQDSELLLVRSVDVPLSLARIDTAKLEAEETMEAERYLQAVGSRLSTRGVRVRSAVLKGPPALSILDAASREKATMIAMSTHGRGGLSRWILGSVSEKVIRASEVPVLLLRSFRPDLKGSPVPVGDGQVPFRRILVPFDGSEESRASLPAVEHFARLCESEVLFLTVVPEPGAAPSEETASLAKRANDSGIKARALSLEGDPAGRVLDVAEAEGADLIAMATHGRSGVSRWLLGSVTERVLRSSTTPLLVVRSAAPGAVRLGG